MVDLEPLAELRWSDPVAAAAAAAAAAAVVSSAL